MAESVTIKIFEEWGALKQAKQTILQLGTIRFGEPSEEVKRAVEGIDKLDRFDDLNIRLLKVGSWDELLAAPAPKPRKSPRRKRA